LVAQQEEKAGIILVSKVFGIYNVIAILALLPIMGVYGAAIASGSAQLLKNGFIWWHVRSRARWTNAMSALVASLMLWAAVVVACRAMGATLARMPIVSLGVGVVIVAVACLLHVRGPAVSADDRRILSGVFRGKEAEWLRRLGLLRSAGTGSGMPAGQ
jgi:peptidoglycan biosynthesis protein MviN/MurJ (putative lipid II flippase)